MVATWERENNRHDAVEYYSAFFGVRDLQERKVLLQQLTEIAVVSAYVKHHP